MANNSLIHAELTKRIREALVLKDWARLEHWAKQWILLAPNHGAGFKWLARAYLAQNKLPKAAYAYGRLLDFESDNDEARKFFAQYPSTLLEQPAAVAASLKRASAVAEPNPEGHVVLTPDQRREVASAELKLAETYEKLMLYTEAAERHRKSYDWHPSQKAALGAARCLHRVHRGLEAVNFLRQQVLQFPEWSEGRMLLARILFELGHLADAQREWQTVLRFDPENREAIGFLRTLHTGSFR
jgi:tetratricopeptide (TPR) repeat protein